MQLPEILKSIVLLQLDNEMPCFDPQDVIFVTNKWDQIEHNAEGSDENSSDEDDVTKTWEALKADIKKNWTSVKDENIFKMSLKEVSMKTHMLFKINNQGWGVQNLIQNLFKE